MPYFLVSHRSLVEASTERAAAEAALLTLYRAKTITFAVTVDQDNIKHVVLTPPVGQIEVTHFQTEPATNGSLEAQSQSSWRSPAALTHDLPTVPGGTAKTLGCSVLLFAAGLLVGVVLALP